MVNILHGVAIKAPMEAVYKALATQGGLAGWWTRETSGESAVGQTLQFRFCDAAGVEIGVIDMKVLELAPHARVLWQVAAGPEEWIGTRVEFELRQDGEYVRVLFKHTGWQEPVEFMHHCSTKLAIFLMSLKAFVETGKGQPSPDDVKIDNWN